MMQKKVLITDDLHPLMIEGLTELGYTIDYQPDITLEAVRACIEQYEGLIINSKILVDKLLLNRAVRLRFVARLGSGMEIVDKPYAAQKGVAVLSSPEGNCNAVAEHALGMLLAFANNLLPADREVRQKIWLREKNRGFELAGKTIGIIGFGHTGSAFARKLKGMEMRVLAYDKYKSDYTQGFEYVEETTLENLQAQADIISFHLPLNPETKYFFDADFLKKCQKKLVILNTSRGNVVKTTDLIQALEKETILGACLDVFENEKPMTYTQEEEAMYEHLYTFPNVILSPHVAGWTHESKYKLSKVLLEKIEFLFL
jgi:D-3-phosphoglycerate dehydrogenase / 2-oxoglutarate reductase